MGSVPLARVAPKHRADERVACVPRPSAVMREAIEARRRGKQRRQG